MWNKLCKKKNWKVEQQVNDLLEGFSQKSNNTFILWTDLSSETITQWIE